jgi:hypothetical protein
VYVFPSHNPFSKSWEHKHLKKELSRVHKEESKFLGIASEEEDYLVLEDEMELPMMESAYLTKNGMIRNWFNPHRCISTPPSLSIINSHP